MSPAIDRLAVAVAVTQRVAARLRLSLAEGLEFAHVAETVGENDIEMLRSLDAFVQRFQQSVEVMTHRLYPAIYRTRQAGERPPPLVTLLAFLESEGVIANELDWIERIGLRKTLIHEYPLTDEERYAAMGRAQWLSAGIIDDLTTALAYIDSYRLLESRHDH